MIPPLDTYWLLVCAGLVFVMQVGFLALEAGLTRTKNAINVAIKNVADFSLSLVLFWALGFGLVFGASKGGWIGSGPIAPGHESLGEQGTAFLLFQGMFCGTAVTIVAGAVAERMRFAAYLVLSFMVCVGVYPLVAHWVWGGIEGSGVGWLREIGFVDFAGSAVVHAVGGAAALAGVLVLGPREGRFGVGASRRVPASSLPIAMLGVLLLWFGWIGFNGGSNLRMDGNVPRVIVCTMLAGAAGLWAALAVGWRMMRYADPGLIICGVLGGLVAVTASCHAVSFPSAIVIGAIGGLLAVGARAVLERLRIDDAVDAIPVHLVCGVWGAIAFALFVPEEALVAQGGRAAQLWVQILGSAAIVVATFGACFAFLHLLNRLWPLRVSREAEEVGLNVAEHRAPNDLQLMLSAMDRQARTHDLSQRLQVEPFTEVGHIAARYNEVMSSLEGSLTSISELEETRDRLEEARASAVEALEAKGAFLATMSHELRTPLNAIIGYTDLLLADAEAASKGGEEVEFLERIQASGEHLTELINDVLDLAKLEAGKLQIEEVEVELPSLVHDCVEQLRPRAMKAGLDLSVVIDPEVPETAYTDPTRMRQVLFNLLSNAIKFTEEGVVRVELEGVSSMGQSSTSGDVELRVVDTGIGMDSDQLQRIFEPFTQADASTTRRFGGTGLGLSLSRRIAHQLGGDILVESRPGEGSTFTFRFQSQAQEPQAIEAHPA